MGCTRNTSATCYSVPRPGRVCLHHRSARVLIDWPCAAERGQKPARGGGRDPMQPAINSPSAPSTLFALPVCPDACLSQCFSPIALRNACRPSSATSRLGQTTATKMATMDSRYHSRRPQACSPLHRSLVRQPRARRRYPFPSIDTHANGLALLRAGPSCEIPPHSFVCASLGGYPATENSEAASQPAYRETRRDNGGESCHREAAPPLLLPSWAVSTPRHTRSSSPRPLLLRDDPALFPPSKHHARTTPAQSPSYIRLPYVSRLPSNFPLSPSPACLARQVLPLSSLSIVSSVQLPRPRVISPLPRRHPGKPAFGSLPPSSVRVFIFVNMVWCKLPSHLFSIRLVQACLEAILCKHCSRRASVLSHNLTVYPKFSCPNRAVIVP